MAICRECIQAITWITTNTGRKMPVNMEPVYIVTFEGKDKFVLNGDIVPGRLAKPGEKSRKAFVPHWATCTAPNKFRRKYGDEGIVTKDSDVFKRTARLF